MMSKHITHQHEDRQWDIRINVQDDDYLHTIVENVMMEAISGKYKYVLLGGLEIGTRPNHTDYQVRHFHAALITHNRVSKGSILKNWGIIEGNGYYMVPRDRNQPYDGWKNHHTKEFSKINPEASDGLIIYEYGELPLDRKRKSEEIPYRSEKEKKMSLDDTIRHMRKLIEAGQEEEARELYPRNYLQYGEKIKALMAQNKRKTYGPRTEPHLYIHGFPGSGKTSLIHWLYPTAYKKDMSTHFWEMYDDNVHTHTLLEDLDMDNIEKLTVQKLKTWCDEAGFNYDQKYKSANISRTTVIVTSQYTIDQLINPDNTSDVEGTKRALRRRFFVLRVDALHRLLGIKLIPEYERKQLRKAGNSDASKIYLSWDYTEDVPTGEPLKTSDEYRELVKNAYYA